MDLMRLCVCSYVRPCMSEPALSCGLEQPCMRSALFKSLHILCKPSSNEYTTLRRTRALMAIPIRMYVGGLLSSLSTCIAIFKRQNVEQSDALVVEKVLCFILFLIGIAKPTSNFSTFNNCSSPMARGSLTSLHRMECNWF